MNPRDFFQNRGLVLAQTRLQRTQADQHQTITGDDLKNILDSVQWCFQNRQWQMIIDFSVNLGSYFDQKSHWQEGIICLNWAIVSSHILNKLEVLSQLVFTLGRLYEKRGQLIEAEGCYRNSANLARRLDQTTVLADAIHRLGWIAHSQHDYSTAETRYREAMDLRDAQDTIGRSRSSHLLGMLAHDQGHFQDAERLYKESLKLRREKDVPFLIAASLHQLGVLAATLGQWNKARNHFSEALDIRHQIQDLRGRASTTHELGVVFQEDGIYQTAQQYYVQSLELKEDLGDGLGLIRTQLQLGSLALEQNDFSQAQGWFQTSLIKYQRLGYTYMEGQVSLRLGLAFYHEQQHELATEQLRHSLDIFRQYDDSQHQQAGILYQLGVIAHDLETLEEARHYYRQSLDIQVASNLPLEAAQTQLQLGMLAQAQQQFSEAQNYYQASYRRFQESDKVLLPQLADVTFRLARLAQYFGENDDARTYYQEALNLYKDIEDSDSKQTIMSIKEALQQLK